MSFVARPRSPLLAPLVGSIGHHAGDPPPPGRERSLPGGDVSLMINLFEDEFRVYDGPDGAAVQRVRGAMLAGPRSRATVIDTAEQVATVSVNFAPGGAAPFLPVPPGETADLLVDLADLWGRDGATLRERLCGAAPEEIPGIVEAVLLDHLTAPPVPDPAVAFAVAAFERGATVSAVTARLGITPKRFARRFRDRVGLTPKRYARVRRLQRVLADVHGTAAVDWAGVAVAHGYFDQSHLIHDFRALTGMTPAAYLRTVGDARNHVPLGVRAAGARTVAAGPGAAAGRPFSPIAAPGGGPTVPA